MQETLVIGVAVKPQGIKGELKIKPFTDDISRFKKLKSVIIEDKTYQVTGAKIAPPFAIISLSGVFDRNAAETFRGKFLHVTRENAVTPKQGTYFIADIIGCDLTLENGQKVGEITQVTSAKTDIFTVYTIDRRIMRFPFLKDLIFKVDVENKFVSVYEKRLGEVSCYED